MNIEGSGTTATYPVTGVTVGNTDETATGSAATAEISTATVAATNASNGTILVNVGGYSTYVNVLKADSAKTAATKIVAALGTNVSGYTVANDNGASATITFTASANGVKNPHLTLTISNL